MKNSTNNARRMRTQGGFTLLEVVIAFATLIIGVLGFSRAIYSWSRASDGGKLKTQAVQAARSTMEDLQSRTFADAFSLFNGIDGDNPVGQVSPGASFAVRGLSPWPNDADGLPGEIIFPSVTAFGVESLRENVQIPQLGMPRDLNADGIIDGDNHSADYRLLPVIVRVRWLGPNGRSQVEFKTILGEFL